MAIPFGYYQGNRAEYMAALALSKIGFVVPVPRQEDHFGVDLIVHLAKVEDHTVMPSGSCFGIQIKSGPDELVFDRQRDRDCLFDMTLPFFLGIMSKQSMTLSIYTTLTRWCFFWQVGPDKPLQLVPGKEEDALVCPDYEKGQVFLGKPVLKISIEELADSAGRVREVRSLQKVMKHWVKLENEAISWRLQQIPFVLWPAYYTTNEIPVFGAHQASRFAHINSLPNMCGAIQAPLHTLEWYIEHTRQLIADGFPVAPAIADAINSLKVSVSDVRVNCAKIIQSSYRERNAAPQNGDVVPGEFSEPEAGMEAS